MKSNRKLLRLLFEDFFSALNTTGKENLEALSKSIMSFERSDMESVPEFRSYDAALDVRYSVRKAHCIGLIFEKMCQDYLLYYADNLPIELSEIGQWWGNDSKRKKQIQIDIVGTPVEDKGYIIGSCKYRNEKIGMDELELLRDYASVFGKAL
mgnify:FL=1